jgi:hypothetical protein
MESGDSIPISRFTDRYDTFGRVIDGTLPERDGPGVDYLTIEATETEYFEKGDPLNPQKRLK